MDIRGSTRVFALLGDPVAHSLSPALQNAAFRALGLDAVYVPLRCEASALAALMSTLAAQGGGGNVTIPHKAAAALLLARAGRPPLPVCNTFWGEAGRVVGAETDSDGILAALARLDPPPGDWCLVGTGGSARAALRAARRAGVRVAVRSRAAERAAAFAATARVEGVEPADARGCEVVLNCTPLGLGERDPLPVAPGELPAARVALDLVYRRGETAWVR
ncbi:MAG TPA: hypothetical protein VGQ17_12990, partial [Gemmatimonadales bacterium]|nr:hypothetical protein [Gemmatimonadales bacterium]